MKEINVKKSKLLICFLSILLVFSIVAIPAYAASKSISTDRGTMEATATGYYLSPTKEKCLEYMSFMKSGLTTRLYLKSSTVEYLTGNSVKKVARFGGSGRTEINDYFYLKNYATKKLKSYTTHEAIYTNAHTVQLSVTY